MIKSKVKVLIVESIFSEINSIVDELIARGCLTMAQVCVTQGACEAIDYLHQCSEDELPSLILLSVELPELKGVDFLKALNKTPRYRDIPSVVFSQSELALDISECYQAAGSRVVGTPIEQAIENQVVKMIEGLINSSDVNLVAKGNYRNDTGFFVRLASTLPVLAVSALLLTLPV